jgi:hypothetical protein
MSSWIGSKAGMSESLGRPVGSGPARARSPGYGVGAESV